MAELVYIKDMFDMSDEDADGVMEWIVELVNTHKTIPGVIKELTTKHSEESILAGMMVQKAIDRNDRVVLAGKTSGGFATAFVFGEALEMSFDEAQEVCGEVAKLATDQPGWKDVFAAVGQMFGERAVYAGAFLLYLYTNAEGEPKKKYDFGHG